MAGDSGDWEGQSYEDLQLLARKFDPLAELAAELALCYTAIEEHRGAFCSACTCQLEYHLSFDETNVCESCGCEEIYTLCVSCGKGRPLMMFMAGDKECKYCHDIPPVRIKPGPEPKRMPISDYVLTSMDERVYYRDEEAWKVLKELME